MFRGGDDVADGARSVREPKDERAAPIGKVDADGDVHLEVTLQAGETRGLVLETGADGPPHAIRVSSVRDGCSSETRDFWRDWISQSTYRGRWREMLDRSAITLKLMTYAPTGGLVAAPTAGLPEQVGGERNWDYRYTWIRDASFSVYSLLGLGFTEEARDFVALAARPGVDENVGSERRPAEDHVPRRRVERPRRGDPRSTGRATADRRRCASATARPTSCSSTSTARRWTASTSPTRTGCRLRTPAG